MVQTLHEKLFTDENENYLFSLALMHIESEPFSKSLYWFNSSTIPYQMLQQFEPLISPQLIHKDINSAPYLDYVNEILDFVANEIKQDISFSKFYFNTSLFLDIEGNVKPEIERKYRNAQLCVQNGDLEIINSSLPLHLYYVKQLMSIPKKFSNTNNFEVARITKKKFETSLINDLYAVEYVEIYFLAIRFKVINNKEKVPQYFLALNECNEPILAIRADQQH
jgi:hypothetical protein